MKATFLLSDIPQADPKIFGGKAIALLRLHEDGFKVPDVASLVHTGDEVTVDGYLGIVTVRHQGRTTARHDPGK